MIVCGIDPGPRESAYVLWDGTRITEHEIMLNPDLLGRLSAWAEWPLAHPDPTPGYVVIEQIRGFGIPAGNELLDTVFWSGRFYERFGHELAWLVPRKEAAAHLCGRGGISKDQFVRQALIERFGGKELAIGSKKEPGPLYGISSHEWAALAVAITWWDNHPLKEG